MSVEDYIKSCKAVLRHIGHITEDFSDVDSLLAEEWADQIEYLIHNGLTFLLKATSKKQALQITAISKRFNKHRKILEDLGINFP